MYQAIIFDFDYTLGDSTMGIVESVNYALDRLGYKTENIDNIKKTIGLSLKETFKALTGSMDDSYATDFAAYFKEKADMVMVENTCLYEHTLSLLSKLRDAGIKTAIVTTKFHYRIDAILSRFNANHLIDIIVGGEDVSHAKPDPEGLCLAIHKLEVSPANVLYVGDSMVDAKTALNAGVDFAAVLTGTTTGEEFEVMPHVMIHEKLDTDNIFSILST